MNHPLNQENQKQKYLQGFIYRITTLLLDQVVVVVVVRPTEQCVELILHLVEIVDGHASHLGSISSMFYVQLLCS
jgi:hypothetical protein